MKIDLLKDIKSFLRNNPPWKRNAKQEKIYFKLLKSLKKEIKAEEKKIEYYNSTEYTNSQEWYENMKCDETQDACKNGCTCD